MGFKPGLTEICDGCLKAVPLEDRCIAYPFPRLWEHLGGCPLKTNKELEVKRNKKINPIKASKRKDR